MTSRRTVIVPNDLGLHLRAAGQLVKIAERFGCDLQIERDGQRANAKSIMSVLTLAAGKGSELEVIGTGPDAEAAVGSLCDLIERGFLPE